MRILQLSKKVPFPIKDGESMAICSLAQSLKINGSTIDLLCLNTLKHKYSGEKDSIHLPYYNSITWIDINTQFDLFKFFLNLFSSIPYQISRFSSISYQNKLIEILKIESYHFILLETIYMVPYIPIIKKYSQGKIILRSHNIEFEIWNRLAEGTNQGIKKWFYLWLSKKIQKFESTQLENIDTLIAISERELETFKKFYPSINGIVIPITWAKNFQDTQEIYFKGNFTSLCFIGSLDWKPNVEGLIWFLNSIWPRINLQFPTLMFYVAGSNMPDKIKNLKIKGVKMVGEVENATYFVSQHDVCIVPILSGSGMRAKIIEAMALGKTVLTTSIGLEGIQGQNGYDVYVADSPKQFLEVIQTLYANPDIIRSIGLNAQKTVNDLFNSEAHGWKLIEFLNQPDKSIA